MQIEVILPQLGESVIEGTIIRWLKQAGESLVQDEPLVEVETDKVNVEIPAITSGRLAAILIPEGTTVPVGTAIALIDGTSAQPASEQPTVSHECTQIRDATAAKVDEQLIQPRRIYSPAVMRLSREHDVEADTITGTGWQGRVTKLDVEQYIAQHVAPAEETEEYRYPLTPMRRSIAAHMVSSLATIPHAWTVFEVDMTAVVETRSAVQEGFRLREGFELTYLPVVLWAVCKALEQHQRINASWHEEYIKVHPHVHLGIAVGVDDGIIVPVVRNADRLSFTELARCANRLILQARAGKLRADEVRGGTLTINNTGTFGSILSYPIIHQPQAAMLTMEAIVKRPVIITHGDSDMIAIRSMMYMCLSFDHRILDGLAAGRFMQTVKRILESFDSTILS